MEQRTKKNLLFTMLKMVVSAVLLSFIVKRAGPGNVLLHVRSMDVRLFLLSTVTYVVVGWLVALRWRILLDNKFPVKKLFSLHMVGAFFNLVLPGSMGGDAVKVYYLYRETKQGGTSFGSVFLDRSLGLFARLSLGLVSGLFAFRELKTIGMHWAAPLLFAAFIAGSLLLFRLRIGRRFGAVADFYDYLHSSLKNRRLLLKTFLLSLAIQALLILMIAATARGIGRTLSFTQLFVFVPIIITVMIVPLSISGFGVREGAFVVLFGLTGIPPSISVSISFLWFLSMATASLIGLVEYVRYKKKLSGPEPPASP